MIQTTSTAVPGLLYVASSRNDVPEAAFDKWYNDIHIRDILELKEGFSAAFRYKATDERETPYLALYPVKDLGFLETKEFASLPTADPILPGPSHDSLELCTFDIRVYRLDDISPAAGKASRSGAAPTVLVCPSNQGGKDEEDAKWYAKVGDLLPAHRGSSKYTLVSSPPRLAGRGDPEASTSLTLHFSDEQLQDSALAKVKEALSPAGQRAYGLIYCGGDECADI